MTHSSESSGDFAVYGTVFQLQRFSVHDGDGLRTTVFFKGCPLRCRWCHNPEGLEKHRQIFYTRESCISCGRCAAVCPRGSAEFDNACLLCGACAARCPTSARRMIGERVSAQNVVDYALRDRAFYGQNGGITCSGGECTMQPEFLLEVLRMSRQHKITTAVDTCGYAPRHVFESIAPYTDQFLYDIKLITSEAHRLWTGADNELILANYRWLAGHGYRIEVRVPLIAGVNDKRSELGKIAVFLLDAGKPEKLKVLPFHSPGDKKYAQLGMTAWHPEEASDMTADEAQRYLQTMLWGM